MALNNNNLSVLRDYREVYCEVAREALSARLDDEPEPVPAARVDEHLDECPACRVWFDQVAGQVEDLRRLVHSRPAIAPLGALAIGRMPPRRRLRMTWQRWALLCGGIVQIALATGQGLGLSLGLTHEHGMSSGSHLLNESTSWSIALGVAMVGAALWTGAAAGLAGVLTVFVGVLTVYVVVDAMSGGVTTTRILTHIPVVIGAVFAIMVWRSSAVPRPVSGGAAVEPGITLPPNASRGRRRGHLWSTDGRLA